MQSTGQTIINIFNNANVERKKQQQQLVCEEAHQSAEVKSSVESNFSDRYIAEKNKSFKHRRHHHLKFSDKAKICRCMEAEVQRSGSAIHSQTKTIK